MTGEAGREQASQGKFVLVRAGHFLMLKISLDFSACCLTIKMTGFYPLLIGATFQLKILTGKKYEKVHLMTIKKMSFFGFNWFRFWQKLTPSKPFYFLNKLCSGPEVTKKFTAVIYEWS
jgi:hypothetical protein